MFFRLLILFTIIPVIEILIFLSIGDFMGPWAVVGLILLTGITGAALARHEGLRVLLAIQEQLAGGTMPAREMVDGGLILAGGLLLLTPGFFTDVVGLSLVLPMSRALMRDRLIEYFKLRLETGAVQIGWGP